MITGYSLAMLVAASYVVFRDVYVHGASTVLVGYIILLPVFLRAAELV